jgi:hypothetical protein
MNDAAKPGVTFGDPNAGRDASDNPVETHEAQAFADGQIKPEGQEPDLKVQIVEPVGDEVEPPETTTIDKDFIYVHNLDPARQIPGTNPYLDVEQRKAAEVSRAAVEGREPDLENPPASQGTPFRSAEQLAAELPPHATVKADVTLPVTVTKDEADAAADREEVAKRLQTQNVFNDPAKAQSRQNAEGNESAESGRGGETDTKTKD